MSAPHVAGTAALVWGVCPELDNKKLRLLLQKTALNMGNDDGWDFSFGYGLVQAFDAWHHCQAADLGDLPRSYGQARHTGNGELRLGSVWGMNSWQGEYPGAGHDDLDDEGLSFSLLEPGQKATVWVAASIEGRTSAGSVAGVRGEELVSGWLDFDQNGIFSNEEMIVDGPVSLNSVSEFSFDVPSTVAAGAVLNYRFRLFDMVEKSQSGKVAVGQGGEVGTINGGEVEDGFVITLVPTALNLHEISVSSVTRGWVGPVFLFCSGLLLAFVALFYRRLVV